MDKIGGSFQRIAILDQKTLRQKVTKEKKEQIIFVSTNNPKNPLVFGQIMKFLKCLTIGTNEKFNRIFKNVEFIQSRKQPPNLGLTLQHSYFGTQKFEHGVKKCKARSCATCEYLEEGGEGVEADFPNANVTLKVNHKFSCDSGDLLYKLACKGWKDYYIGRTTCVKDRFAGHKINKNK